MTRTSKCTHCNRGVTWIGVTPYDSPGVQHFCDEYLDALRNPRSTRKPPKSWAYIPKNAAEQRLGLHFKPNYFQNM